jgi:hypothetical protein
MSNGDDLTARILHSLNEPVSGDVRFDRGGDLHRLFEGGTRRAMRVARSGSREPTRCYRAHFG